jgi:hypothetical protein
LIVSEGEVSVVAGKDGDINVQLGMLGESSDHTATAVAAITGKVLIFRVSVGEEIIDEFHCDKVRR